MNQRILPAEWAPQAAIQLTWPHAGTDWAPMMEVATACFLAIGREIAKRQKLLVVCQNPIEVYFLFQDLPQENIEVVQLDSDDTWARDHSAITVLDAGRPVLLDFRFNGWGNKFPAAKDNLIAQELWEMGVFSSDCQWENHQAFVLEGGGIESDGKGTILTTTSCLLNPNRNPERSSAEIEQYLQKHLGAKRILWLPHGHLAGDDTDGHIDTLARFCNESTIAYVVCEDPQEEHFEELAKMEAALKAFRTLDGAPYQLIPLPMADPVYEKEERLPATYANFLILNTAILLPFYGTAKDQVVKGILEKVFPGREVVGVDCQALIRQHGSLHCVTMQYAAGSF